ncbi:Drug/Metabolite Transporter (DMT) Superfamily [Achlya hypogyna]|uniref:Drug/Metabolite Transporter (DMT) Superfamily n=1 Tax=Achlya hypogyna TaxID=1202772 RepID=A0A1V9YWU3_ACHHY|nr:Drug/Metabolite Transporter (DMT) Superfamily [Achlya hypogyna]
MAATVEQLKNKLSSVLPTSDPAFETLEDDAEVKADALVATAVPVAPSAPTPEALFLQIKFERVGLLLQVVGSCCVTLVAGMTKHGAKTASVDSMVLWQSFFSLIVGIALQSHFRTPLLGLEGTSRNHVIALGGLQYLVCLISSHAYATFELTDATILLLASSLLTGLLATKVIVQHEHDGLDMACSVGALIALVFVQAPDAASEFVWAIGGACGLGLYYGVLFKLHEAAMLDVYTYMSAVSFVFALGKSVFIRTGPVFQGAVVPVVLMGILRALGQLALLRGYQFEHNPIAAAMVFFKVAWTLLLDSIVVDVIHMHTVMGALVLCVATGILVGKRPRLLIAMAAELGPIHPDMDDEPLLLATDGVVLAPAKRHSKPLRHLRRFAKKRLEFGRDRSKFFGFAMIIGGNVALSLMTVFIKFAAAFLDSDEIVFWRSSTALAMNVGVQLYLGIPILATPAAVRKLLAIRVCIGYIAMTMSFYAYSKMNLSEASVIIFTAPIVTCVLSVCLLGEKLDTVTAVCVLVSFCGVVCVARPAAVFGVSAVASEAPPMAMLCAMLTAVCVGLINILIRMLQDVNTWTLVTYFLLTCMVGSATKIILFGARLFVPTDGQQIANVLAIGFFGCIGQFMITKGLQIEKAGIASVLQYLNMLCVMLWDVTLLGESLHTWSIVGAAIISTSAVAMAYRKSVTKT